MRRISTTTFLGIIALAVTGCGSSDNSQSVSPSPSIPPVATNPSPITPVTPKSPVIAQNPSGTVYLAPSLIQPTNANQRVKQVAKGRRDPFAALFAPVSTTPIPVGVAPPSYPTAQAPTNSSATTNKQQTPSSSANGNAKRNRPNSTVAVGNSGSTSNSDRRSNSTKVSTRNNQPSSTQLTPPGNTPPSGLPGNNLQPALPPAPLEPDLAQNVTVMGVVQIGEATQAIVQVPNEATSRYVQVGQRLSNGQVLVKRIDMDRGAEPVVILEQYGVEVAKAVGEVPAKPNDAQTSPAAALPSLSPSITTQAAVNPSRVPRSIPTQAVNPSRVPRSIPNQAVNPSRVPRSIPTQAVNPSRVPRSIPNQANVFVPPPTPNTPTVEAN